MQVLMEMMSEAARRGARRGTGNAARPGGGEAADFIHGTFAHGNEVRSRGNALSQKPVPQGSGITDSLGNARQPEFERGPVRVGQRQADLKSCLTQLPRNAPNRVAVRKSQH